jgi:hypothetical protein
MMAAVADVVAVVAAVELSASSRFVHCVMGNC